jgi:hypothetical protein
MGWCGRRDRAALRRTSAASQTLARIPSFTGERPTVYLVAHDPDTPTRLESRDAADAERALVAT